MFIMGPAHTFSQGLQTSIYEAVKIIDEQGSPCLTPLAVSILTPSTNRGALDTVHDR